jgi:WD40 repeat protein
LEKCQSQVINGHEDWVWNVVVSHEGKKAVSVGADKKLLSWNLETFEYQLIGSYENGFLSIVITPDGGKAVTGSSDGTLRLWDLYDNSFEILGNLKGTVWSVAVSHDGKKSCSWRWGNLLYLKYMEFRNSKSKTVNGPINSTVGVL